MATIWKSKVLPKITKVFGSTTTRSSKKAAAAEAIKSFDESKEEISKEFEKNKTELEPIVREIYEASAAEIKSLMKKPADSEVKKNSAAVKKLLEELAKLEFPGSKPVSEAAAKYGPANVLGPITFVFEKVTGLLPAEEPASAPAEVESSSKDGTANVAEEIKQEEAVMAGEKAEENTPPLAVAETPAPPEPAPVASAEEPKPEPEPEPAKA